MCNACERCLDRAASNIISRRYVQFRWSAVFRRCRRRRRLTLVHRLPPGGDLWHEHVERGSIFVHRWRERCSSDCRCFSLNPVQHAILPHRQSQLSDLTIRLHITTSLKSISQKRWLYHQIFKRQQLQTMSRDQLKIRYFQFISM